MEERRAIVGGPSLPLVARDTDSRQAMLAKWLASVADEVGATRGGAVECQRGEPARPRVSRWSTWGITAILRASVDGRNTVWQVDAFTDWAFWQSAAVCLLDDERVLPGCNRRARMNLLDRIRGKSKMARAALFYAGGQGLVRLRRWLQPGAV
jgi:hypothetical protein